MSPVIRFLYILTCVWNATGISISRGAQILLEYGLGLGQPDLGLLVLELLADLVLLVPWDLFFGGSLAGYYEKNLAMQDTTNLAAFVGYG